MFKRLGEAHPNAVVCLTAQYRMNADIMAVSNALIYEHRLCCGSQSVAEARLSYSRRTELIDLLPLSHTAWLHHCLAPENSVVFINTDCTRDKTDSHQSLSVSSGLENMRPALQTTTATATTTTTSEHDGREREYQSHPSARPLQDTTGAAEKQSSSGIGGGGGGGGDIKKGALHNPTEISIITLLVEAFSLCGLENIESAVGIISPYRAQVRSIQKALLNLAECSLSSEMTSAVEQQAVSGPEHVSLSASTLSALAKQGVSTVDKYQGRDMEVIILSLVRSNERGQVGNSPPAIMCCCCVAFDYFLPCFLSIPDTMLMTT